MKFGITTNFYQFIESLKKRNVSKKLSLLMLSGRIEEYLVKEFAYHIYEQSNGKRFGLTNIGNNKEQKIDLAVIRGDYHNLEIESLLEAKYLRNKHRIWDADAKDEIRTSLKSLSKQCHKINSKQHGGIKLSLISKDKIIYGLVFGSYVESEKDKDKKAEFFDKCLSVADELHFRYHDLKNPYWRSCFEDIRVELLDKKYKVTLKAGLWRKKA